MSGHLISKLDFYKSAHRVVQSTPELFMIGIDAAQKKIIQERVQSYQNTAQTSKVYTDDILGAESKASNKLGRACNDLSGISVALYNNDVEDIKKRLSDACGKIIDANISIRHATSSMSDNDPNKKQLDEIAIDLDTVVQYLGNLYNEIEKKVK
ncbi:MAG: hypothetical protein V4691_05605 [Pseudomonadota bacterium]